ncbi:hypothetical protein ACWGOQ_0013850 [Aquimarina sp. M1]
MKLYYDGSGSTHSRDQNWEWWSLPDTTSRFIHKMNLYGFRDKEWFVEKTTGKKRAVFIGDSFVEGVMAAQDETIPLAFEHVSNGKYETFNGGLLGCGLNSYLQLIADLTPTYRPDAIFLCIYANDLGKENPKVPEFFLKPEYYNPYTPRLVEIFKQSSTYGPLRFRWANHSKPYLPAVPKESNPWSVNEVNLQDHVTPWLVKHMKTAAFNPFLTNSLQKEETFLKAPPAIGETIGFFKYICNKYSIKPVIVYIPSRNQVTDYYLKFEKKYCLKCSHKLNLTNIKYQRHQKVLKKQCDSFGIQFIDLTRTIKAKESNGEHVYWNYDQHMRASGYKLVGETIWDKWKDK